MIRVPLSDKYQLDRLLLPQTDPRTEKFKPGFETVAACIAEDQLHARSLWETAARIRKISTGIWPLSAGAVALKNLNIDPDAALNLANPCGGRNRRRVPQPTLASALFMRGARTISGARAVNISRTSAYRCWKAGGLTAAARQEVAATPAAFTASRPPASRRRLFLASVASAWLIAPKWEPDQGGAEPHGSTAMLQLAFKVHPMLPPQRRIFLK